MLTRLRTNGGDAIIGRALFITMWVFLVAIGLQALVDPERTVPSWNAFREQALDLAPWASAVFGGAYLALYARFSSQWGYLANLYNQIKQVEASEKVNDDPLAAWKAGFIEDAENLHLACKASIAPIIHAWVKDGRVETAYVRDVPGGKKRLDALKKKVAVVHAAVAGRYP
jgi:hypothetical protein